MEDAGSGGSRASPVHPCISHPRAGFWEKTMCLGNVIKSHVQPIIQSDAVSKPVITGAAGQWVQGQPEPSCLPRTHRGPQPQPCQGCRDMLLGRRDLIYVQL